MQRKIQTRVILSLQLIKTRNFAGVIGAKHASVRDRIGGIQQNYGSELYWGFSVYETRVKTNDEAGFHICVGRDVPLIAQFLKSSWRAPLFSEDGRGSQKGAIVNCASVNSSMSGQGTVPYTTSKHAVIGITKAVRQTIYQINYSLLIPVLAASGPWSPRP
jgi:NAD(P)-dependent dehydrogenase (short-subunit alcohol dehydrogenase family)